MAWQVESTWMETDKLLTKQYGSFTKLSPRDYADIFHYLFDKVQPGPSVAGKWSIISYGRLMIS
jgi:hypothetical protein